MNQPDPITAYIDTAPEPGRMPLRDLRSLARKLYPGAEEVMSYRLPAFKDGKVFLYYAAFTNHIGIYPPVQGSAALMRKVAPYLGPKGNLQFKYEDGLPMALVEDVMKALHKAYATSPAKR